MSTTCPIKSETQLKKFEEYYLLEKPVCRNYTLIILGLNTAFRISDLLLLEWKDVFHENETRCRDHITIIEHKTGKTRSVAVNNSVRKALDILWKARGQKRLAIICSQTAVKNSLPFPAPRHFVSLRKPLYMPACMSISVAIHSERPSVIMHGKRECRPPCSWNYTITPLTGSPNNIWG